MHLQETQLEQVRDYLRSDAYIEFMAAVKRQSRGDDSLVVLYDRIRPIAASVGILL